MSMNLSHYLLLSLMVLLQACNEGVTENSQILEEASGALRVSLTNEGLIQLTATNQEPVEDVIAVTITSTSLNKRTLDVGIQNITITVGGKRCTAQGGGAVDPVLMCETTTALESATTTEPELTANNLTQRVTIDPAMHCALHNDEPQWQARFSVSIGGSAADLQLIEFVEYDVFSTANAASNIKGSDPGNGFDPGSDLFTPDSGWSTGPASVTLKSGSVLTVPGTAINWTNSEPDVKPTGQACEL